MTHEHLTNTQIEDFRTGRLNPADLPDVTEHLVRCGECRTRVRPNAAIDESISHLQRTFESHLTDDELIAAVDEESRILPPSRITHLEHCAPCRSELQDLRAFRTRVHAPSIVRKRQPVWLTLVAAAVLLVAFTVSMWRLAQPPSTADKAPQSPVISAPQPSGLPAPYQQMIDQALASREIERAPVLDTLLRRDVTLLGSSTESLQVTSPVGIVTASDRPTFRWQRVPGASEYVVSVYDSDFRKIAESSRLTSPQWQPMLGLPRGSRLSWQVVARVGDKEEKFPAPPAREAVFEVLDARSAEDAERVRQMEGSSPLLLALIYARAGALEDAESELRQAPDSPEVKALLESLQRLRQVQTGSK